VGGVVIGRFVNGVLDRIILSKQVAGLMGVELQANVAKWLKPTLVGLAGFGLMSYGKNQGSTIMQNIGLGVAGYGISGMFTAITAKNLLSGFGADDEYIMLDANGNRIGNIDMKQLLPDLETPEFAGTHYAIMDGTGGMNDDFPMILDGSDDDFSAQVQALPMIPD